MTLEEALQNFSTKAELANALGITRQAINKWQPGKPIPREQALALKYEVLPKLKANKEQSTVDLGATQ